jgi:5-formyltetrahydrofolate cyclo-ligase
MNKRLSLRSKEEIRDEVWTRMEREGVARFPGARGRIPNFVGAEESTTLLPQLEIWQRAKTIKSNPDLPQRPLRESALLEGKWVYMAVPRLRDEKCFVELDPAHVKGNERGASTIKGAFRLGRLVRFKDMRRIDLIVAGSVAVNEEGGRVGKGGGYSDLEYGLALEAGIIEKETPLLTTVHPLQIVQEEIEMKAHDIPIDFILTQDRIIATHHKLKKPDGIYWEMLNEEMLQSIPVLQDKKSK